MPQLTPFERARLYTHKLPPAIAGQEGHKTTWTVATVLVNGFGLNQEEAMTLIREYNASCSPPWSDKELQHKVKQAMERSHDRPNGWALGQDGDYSTRSYKKIESVTQSGKFKVDLGNLSPVPMSEQFTTRELLLNCFKKDEVICITNEAGEDEDGRYYPASRGTFQTTSWWLDKFFSDVAPDKEFFHAKPQGAWIRINPLKPEDYSGRDDSVANFRFVLIEFDTRPKEEQYAIFLQSNLPISCVVDSGSKSLHAWVRVEAKDWEEWKVRREQVFNYLSDYEPDEMTKNPSRWSRLGGVWRGGSEQRIVALNIGVQNWDEWVSYVEAKEVAQEITVDDLYEYDVENDPTTVLGDRWLCKGGSLSIIGQSGIGKSSFLMQMAVMLAIGRNFFQIKVKRPFKCIVMQAENDTGDLAEAFKGVVSSMSISPEEKDLLRKNIKFYRETVKVGESFVKQARKLIVSNKADFFFADPLLSFAGGNLNEQAYASQFLRNWIQPVLMETGVVWVWLHHTGKPKAREEAAGATISDLAYSGLGSSELVNWSREVAVLRRTDKMRPFFELVLTKRGKRAGLHDKDGKSIVTMNLRHAEGRILWEVNDENTLSNFSFADLKKMEGMPPTQHLNDFAKSPLVEYIASKLAIGKETAADVAAQLIRLSQTNPVIVWLPGQSAWAGTKWKETGLDNPF